MRLAWPVIAAYLVQMLFEVVDMAWIGRLDDAEIPLAALTVCMYISWLVVPLIQLIAVGATTLIAKCVGAGTPDEGHGVGREALAFGLPFAIGVAALGIATTGWLLESLQVGPAVADQARGYLYILYGGIGATYWMMTFGAIQQGAGDTVTPLKIGLLSFGLNLVLDPVLIFGFGPIPAMGLQGAAIASLSAKVTAVGIYIMLLRRGLLFVGWADLSARFTLSTVLRCVRIGLPISVLGIAFMLVYLQLVRIIAPFGTSMLAALGVGGRIEGLTYVIVDGLAVATQTLVGQNMGAGLHSRAVRAAWAAVAWGSLVGLTVALAMWFAPGLLVALLAPEAAEQTVQDAILYCRINAGAQLSMAWEIVLAGAFAGVGYTIPAMVISVPITFARIPLAMWLVEPRFGLGGVAVFWAIATTCAARGVIAVIWFRFGMWRRRWLGDLDGGRGVRPRPP